jgi:hypothetical protein
MLGVGVPVTPAQPEYATSVRIATQRSPDGRVSRSCSQRLANKQTPFHRHRQTTCCMRPQVHQCRRHRANAACDGLSSSRTPKHRSVHPSHPQPVPVEPAGICLNNDCRAARQDCAPACESGKPILMLSTCSISVEASQRASLPGLCLPLRPPPLLACHPKSPPAGRARLRPDALRAASIAMLFTECVM